MSAARVMPPRHVWRLQAGFLPLPAAFRCSLRVPAGLHPNSALFHLHLKCPVALDACFYGRPFTSYNLSPPSSTPSCLNTNLSSVLSHQFERRQPQITTEPLLFFFCIEDRQKSPLDLLASYRALPVLLLGLLHCGFAPEVGRQAASGLRPPSRSVQHDQNIT